MFIEHVKREQVFYKLKRRALQCFLKHLLRKTTAEEKCRVSSGVFLLLVPGTNTHLWWATAQNNKKVEQIEGGYLQTARPWLLPAVYAGEEDCLSFICRAHLSGVVNHPLFVAARAPAVNLDASHTTQFPAVDNITESKHQHWPGSPHHSSLHFRVLLLGQRWLLHRVEDHAGVDLLPTELWDMNGHFYLIVSSKTFWKGTISFWKFPPLQYNGKLFVKTFIRQISHIN